MDDPGCLEEFARRSRDILSQLERDRQKLGELVLAVPKDDTLFSLCAHYQAVDKLVLASSEDQKWQLRLHIYSDRLHRSNESAQIDIGNAHNHRWNFSSWILSGGYHHTLYRMDSDTKGFIPMAIRYEGVNYFYTLHHSQFHSILEEPNTVTLILRGPIEKKSFQVIQEGTGEAKWQDAPSLDSSEEKTQKMMSQERYSALVERLGVLGIIPLAD